jgi:hypothetical protein
MNKDQLETLKLRRNEAIKVAEKIAHEYFCECEVGRERELASNVYENVRCSLRVR